MQLDFPSIQIPSELRALRATDMLPSRPNRSICLVLCWVTGCLGVTLGYHRLLTHGSFVTSKPVRWFFAFVGGISGEGSAIVWVANHRKHHAFSDQEGDPHSPRDGGLWSHMLWLFPQHTTAEVDAHVKRWAPDLAKDSGVLFFHKTNSLFFTIFKCKLDKKKTLFILVASYSFF